MLLAAATAKSPSLWAEPGTLGFLVVFGMGVILYFVFRSMSKQLRKVREAAAAEQEQPGPGQGADGGSPPGGLRPDSGDQRPGGGAQGSLQGDDRRRQRSQLTRR
jgi:hypothetical protein